jgi:hypothetical protein
VSSHIGPAHDGLTCPDAQVNGPAPGTPLPSGSGESPKRRAGAALLGLLLLSLATPARAGDVRLEWQAPCFQADSIRCDTLSAIPETTLAAQRVWAVRFRDQDTLYLGEIPEIGKACTTHGADFEFYPGTVGAVLFRSRDVKSNEACQYASYVFAIPADSTWADRPGLLGSYFSDQNLTQLFQSRVDPAIDFDWSTGVALAGMPGDWFSVRWVGKLRSGAAGLYTFRLRLNDAGRLWVGAANVIENWTGDGDHSVSGVVTLAAGVSYPLRAEMYEKTGSARMTLYWTPPGGTESIVPAGAFSH